MHVVYDVSHNIAKARRPHAHPRAPSLPALRRHAVALGSTEPASLLAVCPFRRGMARHTPAALPSVCLLTDRSGPPMPERAAGWAGCGRSAARRVAQGWVTPLQVEEHMVEGGGSGVGDPLQVEDHMVEGGGSGVGGDPLQVEEHMVDGVAKRLLVHRKGATRAFPPHHPLIPVDYQLTGQPVLIGGTMGTHSYVLTGAHACPST